MLIEDGKILLVRQKVAPDREWSLPGGRAESGETLEEAVIREVSEETGLATKVVKLLYLCDKTDNCPPVLHVTFLLERIAGNIALPTNEFDANPISDVAFIAFDELANLGFTQVFAGILKDGFPGAGSYMGHKKNIGL